MSTLVVDTLKTTDGDYSVAVADLMGEVLSFEELRETIPLSEGARIALRGYREGSDYGFGIFEGHLVAGTDDGGVIASNGSDYYWERVTRGSVSVMDFGAYGDGATDDTAAIQAAIDWAQTGGVSVAGGLRRGVTAPDLVFAVASEILVASPIRIDFKGSFHHIGTSGTIISFGQDAGWSNGYEVYIKNLYGNGGSFPTTVDTSGTSGIAIRNVTFSRFHIGAIQNFTHRAMHCDGSGDDDYAQVIQHNTFILGQVVNNGIGITIDSEDAASSSCQVCLWEIQNIYQNYHNIQVNGEASTSHTFRINAMDNQHGVGLDIYGKWNYFWVGFSGADDGGNVTTTLRLNSTSGFNTIEFGNNAETDISISYGGVNNRIITAPPSTSQLPFYGDTVTSGTSKQNTYGVPITVYFHALASSSAEVTIAVGPQSSSLTTILDVTVPVSQVVPFSFRVPAGGYWSATTTTGTVSYGSAAYQDAS